MMFSDPGIISDTYFLSNIDIFGFDQQTHDIKFSSRILTWGIQFHITVCC